MSKLHQDLRQLAAESHAPHTFLSHAVRRMAAYFRTPFIALTADFGAESIEEAWHQGANDPSFWRSVIERHLTDTMAFGRSSCKLLGAQKSDGQIALLGAPLRDEACRVIGAVSMVAEECDRQQVPGQLAVLESVVGFMSLCVQGIGKVAGKAAMGKNSGIDEVLAVLKEHQRPEEIAFAVTNRLRGKLACDQVALGIPVGHQIRVISVSGLDEVNHRSPGVRFVRSAMEECYDLGRAIICPGYHAWAKSSEGTGHRLHWQWSQHAGSDSVASFPISDQNRITAVVSLRRKPDRPLTEAEIRESQAMLSHLAPAIALTRLAKRNLFHHARDSAWATWRKWTARTARRWQIFGGCTALALGWVAFGSMEYRLTVPCVIQAKETRHITAPFEGVIREQRAIAGDIVEAGRVLCLLDNRQLLLQKRSLETQWKVLAKQKDEALAKDEVAGGNIISAQQDEVRAQLDLVQWQLDYTEIRAPIDGVVLTGDLRKKLGSPVTAGQPLFEIAPQGKVLLELAIPEEEIDEIEGRPTGLFATNAAPEVAQGFRVSTIRPSATTQSNRTVFVCEAELDEPRAWFRSGMEGVARVSVGQRRIWWVLLHNMIDYIRIKAWV